MTGTEIIQKFELYTDDTTELSTAEELALANDKAKIIYQEMPWEFLRKAFSGVTNADGTITAPADFVHFMHNYSEDPTQSLPDQAVVYINGYTPYFVVPMGARNNYNSQNGIFGDRNICWFNPSTQKIEFPVSPGGGVQAGFDYQRLPADFVAGTSPAAPMGMDSQFGMAIVHLMCIDDDIIQKSEKARSNVSENNGLYQKILTNLKHNNAKFFFVN